MGGYAKGRSFEHRVKRILEKEGYTVFRCAGSKPVDLIAIKKWDDRTEICLIECKLNGHLPEGQKEKLIEMARRIGASAILAYRGVKHDVIFWTLWAPRYRSQGS